jgi:peptidoglycan/LPS O-acetylase OafA/YrhL
LEKKLYVDNNRLEYLDALRGVAIIAVMFCHYIPYLFSLHNLYPHIIDIAELGRYGVHLFFIISGYVIYMTTSKVKSPAQFAFARFSRLFPVYWVVVTISFLLILWFGHPQGKPVPDMSIYLANLTMMHRFLLIPSVDSVYWTLTFELMFYFYIGVLMCLRLHKRMNIVIYAWLIFSIIFTSIAHYQGVALSERWKGVFILEFNSFFLTGIAFFNFHQSKNYKPLIVTMLLSALQQYLIAGVFLLAVYIIVSVIFIIFSICKVTMKGWLSKVGKISYSLYLVHTIPGYTIMLFLFHQQVNVFVNIAMTFVVMFFLSYVLWFFIEVPAQRLLRNYLYRFLDPIKKTHEN